MERFWGEIIPERPRKADPRIEGLMDALGELSEAKQTLLRKHYFEGRATKAKILPVRGALWRQYRKKIRT
jgi:hypothetical protein